ncbi:MAG: hypothetical protein ABI832_12265, partial [bacterium]
MKFIGVAGLALAALVSVGTPSSAATISNAAFNDGVDDIYGTASRGGYYGANLWLTGDAEISIAYLGAEAGYHNQFLWDNVLKFTTPGGQAWTPAAPAVSLGTVLAGLLNFSFLA